MWELRKPRFTEEQIAKYVKDPEVVTLECLFVVLTLIHLFALQKIVLDICPYPITVTWFQLLTSLLLTYVLGEASREFPRCAFFPPISIDFRLYKALAVPTLLYLGMLVMTNVLLFVLPTLSLFPVVMSLAVALHHVSRFLGCGQIYFPIRWLSLGIMLIGFLVAAVDPRSMGIRVVPFALLFALCSAIFRAWCLEKALHVCEGRGNTLHHYNIVLGVIVLPFLALAFGESTLFQTMPTNFRRFFTWQAWGCLITAGALPWVKNIVANRMVRRTGQAPWRVLELFCMVVVFIMANLTDHFVSPFGILAFLLVFAGRVMGAFDALSKDPNAKRNALNDPAEVQLSDAGQNEPLYHGDEHTLPTGTDVHADGNDTREQNGS